MTYSWGLIVALGLVNWIATTIIVDSSLFAGLRNWPMKGWTTDAIKCQALAEAVPDEVSVKYRRPCVQARARVYVGTLVNCHLCTGTWVAFIQAAFFIRGPWYVFISYALLIKAVGHLTLELRSRIAA